MRKLKRSRGFSVQGYSIKALEQFVVNGNHGTDKKSPDTNIKTFMIWSSHTSAKLIEIQKSSLQTRHGLHESGG